MPSYFSAELLAAAACRALFRTADSRSRRLPQWRPMASASSSATRTSHRSISTVDADYIGITGKVSQWHRMKSIAGEFRRRGKTVRDRRALRVAQPRGRAAALRHSGPRRDRGDRAEDLLRSAQRRLEGRIRRHAAGPAHLADAALGPLSERPRHHGGGADLARLPVRMRVLRRHPVSRPQAAPQAGRSGAAELDQLYRLGYRSAFLADDNFTVYRAHAKELLAAMRDWNERRPADASASPPRSRSMRPATRNCCRCAPTPG